jgi:uncharacterized protein YggU (UPF0235/DUF167 family)
VPPGSLTLRVRVKPRSRDERLTRGADGTLIARVRAPPVDGRANQAVVALLAKVLRVPKGAVAIAGGAGSRVKRISIRCDEPDDLRARIKDLPSDSTPG